MYITWHFQDNTISRNTGQLLQISRIIICLYIQFKQVLFLISYISQQTCFIDIDGFPGKEGAFLRWNIQDLFSNKQVLKQRQFLLQQAETNITNTREQVTNDIARTQRRINQAAALIAVAQKAVTYREEEMKLQEDKSDAGLNIAADILQTKSQLAKAEADLLAAQLSYRLAQSDLKILTGGN